MQKNQPCPRPPGIRALPRLMRGASTRNNHRGARASARHDTRARSGLLCCEQASGRDAARGILGRRQEPSTEAAAVALGGGVAPGGTCRNSRNGLAWACGANPNAPLHSAPNVWATRYRPYEKHFSHNIYVLGLLFFVPASVTTE